MTSTKNEREAGMISMIVCVYEIRRHENGFDMNKRAALLLQPRVRNCFYSADRYKKKLLNSFKCRLLLNVDSVNCTTSRLV